MCCAFLVGSGSIKRARNRRASALNEIQKSRPLSRQFVSALNAVGAIALVCVACPVHAAFPESDLSQYYRDFPNSSDARTKPTSTRPVAELVPRADITGGGPALANVVVEGNSFRYVPLQRPYAVPSLVWYNAYRNGMVSITQFREDVCNGGLEFTNTPTADSSKTIMENYWYNPSATPMADLRLPPYYGVGYGTCNVSLPEFGTVRLTNDEMTFGAPMRRTALDGSQYDASPMKLVRNGLPWYTHFFGYHLGLVANESNWNDANVGRAGDLVGFFRFPSPVNNFELTALPPPWVEEDVVEYVNQADFPAQPGGQFFYAVRAEDKALLDSVPAWKRSGNAFKSGGYVSACRFYGGKNGGPNTHFYSADDKECDALKKIAALNYEGQTFAVNMPMPGVNADGSKPCPIDSKPLYRLYNNASSSNGSFVSNHRYTASRDDVTLAVRAGWVDEGQVMCVPL